MSAMKERLIELAQASGYDPLTAEGWALVFGHEHGEHVAVSEVAHIETRASTDYCAQWLDADAEDSDETLDGCPTPLAGDYGPEQLHDDLEKVLGKPPQAAEPASIGRAYEVGFEQGWRAALRRAARQRIGADRPLVVGDGKGKVTLALRAIAVEAGVEVLVHGEPVNLADGLNFARWRHAPVVLVTATYTEAVAREVNEGTRTRRDGVVLVTHRDLLPQAWRDAVQIGAEHVAELPTAELWLLRTLADTGDEGGDESGQRNDG